MFAFVSPHNILDIDTMSQPQIGLDVEIVVPVENTDARAIIRKERFMNEVRDIVLYSPKNGYPVVTINHDGITYTPSKWSSFTLNTTITWSEVAAIYFREFSRQERNRRVTYPYLAIVPKNILSFLKSYPFFKRMILSSAWQSLGAPITIFATFLPISIDNLFTQIRTQYSDEIEMYGIRTEEGDA